MELSTGDMLDCYRTPASKDVPGWKGPATVTDASNASYGAVALRWQSHAIECRVQDIRRVCVYPVFLTASDVSPYDYVFSRL